MTIQDENEFHFLSILKCRTISFIYNPGLSMHWFESSVYFSAAPMLAFVLPLWSYRLFTLGLIIFPLGGHSGFGSWEKEAEYNHYIHHSKFNWNYGSSPMWDHLMGTDYKPTDR